MSTTVDVGERAARLDAPPPPTSAAPLVAFVVAELIALILWPLLARHRWFFFDEWDFLAARKAGDLGDLFRPHNEHWSTIPILVWRALFWAVGLRSYLPYQLVVVTLHLIAAALLLVVMRRVGVRPWIATAAAILFVFFGSGRTDIVSAFQMSFTGSLVFGLVQLLLSDHDGPLDRRDLLGLGAGLAGLMTSGIGVTMVVVVGIAVLLRRGWAPALFHTVALAAAYMTWFFVIGHQGYDSGQESTDHLVQYVATGFRSAYRAMGQVPGVGLVLAGVLIVGLVLACTDRARPRARARLSGPLALLAGSVVFLAIAAVGRAAVLGVASARVDRYQYLVAALSLPALAVAADALASRYTVLVPVMIALFLVGVPGNIRALDRAERATDAANASNRHLILSLARDPVARQTPPSVRPEPATAPWLTIGWLVDNARSGRVPSPGAVTPRDIASDDFRLSFLQQDVRQTSPVCREPLVLPATVDLERGNVVGLYEGSKVFAGASNALTVKPVDVNLAGPPLRFVPRRHGTPRAARRRPDPDLCREPFLRASSMPGATMTNRGLTRWPRKLASNEVRTVLCLGDSITFAPSMAEIGVTHPWVDQLTTALERRVGPRIGDGFRGLWRDNEWSRSGTWTETQPSDLFDVAPFRCGLYSSSLAADELVWSKPATLTVRAFDLYSFHMPNAGNWQYRVDGGPWTHIQELRPDIDDKLHRYFIDEPVEQRVTIRGHDGVAPCIAPVMGIGSYTSSTPRARGLIVHNLGYQQQFLAQFCRPSAGDPLALLGELAPDLVTVLFSNDVLLRDTNHFARALRKLVTRVAPYADVLIIAPFEQRTHRCVDDAVTVAGSTDLTSQSALFLPTDEGKPVHGANIAAGASIARVNSTEHVTMTAAATGPSSHGEVMIASRRDRPVQAQYRAVTRAIAESLGCPVLDLYDAWTQSVGAGWDAAYAAGLMYDGLHPTQNGHNEIAKRVTQALGI